MVSFSCEVCNDTVIKKKLDQHSQRCYGAYFTCIDCSTTFHGTDHKGHTQCISEAEKYEKALYKGKPSKGAKPAQKETNKVAKETKVKKETTAAVDDAKGAVDIEKTTSKSVKNTKPKGKATKAKEDKAKTSADVDLSKYAGGSLSKVLKSISKDTKTDKKVLLKKMRLELVDGQLVLKL